MTRQVLSVKRTRHYATKTGIPIQRMLARGSSNHWILFRTIHDRHGSVNASTYEVSWDDSIDCHWSSCDVDFPQEIPLGPGEGESAHP